jgi:hypothetical protein
LAVARLKTTKLKFYTAALARSLAPPALLAADLRKTLAAVARYDRAIVQKRLAYYHPVDYPFTPTAQAKSHKTFDLTGINSSYFFDFKEFLRYFDKHFRFDYLFGDNTINPIYPAFVKSRPIVAQGQNAILFKLNKLRHFSFVDTDIPFEAKKDCAVFRGACGRDHRRQFVEKYRELPRTDIGDTRKQHKNLPGWKPFMPLREQLSHKFIISIEGNDVATNLKWILSSNSLCFMRKPRFETWFMEGLLEPGKHYVLLRDDYADLEEKIDYYSTNTAEALGIIAAAQAHVAQFLDPILEKLLCVLVMQRYFHLSGQLHEQLQE